MARLSLHTVANISLLLKKYREKKRIRERARQIEAH